MFRKMKIEGLNEKKKKKKGSLIYFILFFSTSSRTTPIFFSIIPKIGKKWHEPKKYRSTGAHYDENQ
jgi:hypothetical protein